MIWCRLVNKPLPEPILPIQCLRPPTPYGITLPHWVDTLRPRQNGCHFADVTFKRIFVNENVRILIEISLKFVPKGPINNIPALVQIIAWRRSGDKPLSEPMIVSLPTHICVTRPQWVKDEPFHYVYVRPFFVHTSGLKSNTKPLFVGRFEGRIPCLMLQYGQFFSKLLVCKGEIWDILF